jgi:YaiO family outer membrane protein
LKRRIYLAILLSFLTIYSIGAPAEEQTERRSQRVEANLLYESLSPHDIYGSWTNILLTYYTSPKSGLTWFFQLGGFSRKIGDALLGVGGAYKDWGERFYTYTALAAGSDSAYLPQVRFDNDFNIKFGDKRNIVWTLGITYVNYHNGHQDLILSSGITLYFQGLVTTYRIFRNKSDPGNVTSFSHLIDAAYGKEGNQWTNFTISFGNQAYLADYLAKPEEVDQDSLYLILKHRRWIKKGWGILGDLSYFKLEDGYKKFGLSIGFFMEF